MALEVTIYFNVSFVFFANNVHHSDTCSPETRVQVVLSQPHQLPVSLETPRIACDNFE